ncbi:MAG: alanine--tRNA ligase, partial [Chitinophagaceae bacterium]
PTLMFTNAGMNQFKDYFLGNKPAPHPRVADTQKCLRVSGKHNDLEEVGVDTYHHTMFEMLGNWSFGDPERPEGGYFKKEAIEWSWELLTKELQLPVDRIYVTVFEGDDKEGLPIDNEAANEWKKWISEDRILKGNKKDNFWEMGDSGPCGPCTEIHFDTRADDERNMVDGKTLVNADHPLVIEIWNNVFIEFNRLKNGNLQPLPAKHVDTGMGFERLVRVLQQKTSNYDTDIFSGTISKIEELTGIKYKATEADKKDIAFRVLADHIRAIAFTIADGQLPSNTGAGYVIRRILRRAVRYYYSYLNYPQPLLNQLLPVVAKQFEKVFPELQEQQQFISKVIRDEEEAFLRTLEKGLKRIEDIIKNSNEVIKGKDAFELYDTYGFPLDLTRLIANERNLTIDEDGFTAEMQQQKTRSRAATTTDAEDWVQIQNADFSSKFIGYTSLESTSRILRWRKVKAKGKENFQLVLDRTPFYAESGGQVGDTGILKSGDDSIRIIDTKKENDIIIHFAEQLPKNISAEFTGMVDAGIRKKTAVHHSATHLLHAALRSVLGKHVTQQGSLVNADYLRFDFSHFSKLSHEEIASIEKLVNEKIRENIPVVIKQMKKEQALESGAMALFGEKYSDEVRVVEMDKNYSIELCGGTHVGATGELGYFKIISESAIAAGVRRIEALSGQAAETFIEEQLQQLQQVKEALKSPKDVLKGIQNLNNENTSLLKRIEVFEQSQIEIVKKDLLNNIQDLKGVQFIGEVVNVSNADALKRLAFNIKPHLADFLMVLGTETEGKAFILIMISDKVAMEKSLDASQIIKQKVANIIKGGGGGQKTLATAGGQDPSALHQAIEAVKQLI